MTDITEHPTREGKVYCAVVLDVFSRRVVGWSIDSTPTAALVTNALGMAIDQRDADRWTGDPLGPGHRSSRRGRSPAGRSTPGSLPSMGSVGDCFDNAVIESFWSRMQVELLDRQRWRTRVELANAIFEYLEIFHNRQRQRRHRVVLEPHAGGAPRPPALAHTGRAGQRDLRVPGSSTTASADTRHLACSHPSSSKPSINQPQRHEIQSAGSTEPRGTPEPLQNPGRFTSERNRGPSNDHHRGVVQLWRSGSSQPGRARLSGEPVEALGMDLDLVV